MAPTPVSRARALAKVLARRRQWLQDNGPCRRCGSWHELEVHHRDPRDKISHNIWSWRADRRAAELLKCDPICQACHATIHALLRHKPHGWAGFRRGCRCDVCHAAMEPHRARNRKLAQQRTAARRARRLAEIAAAPPADPIASRQSRQRRAESLWRDQYVIVHEDEGESSTGDDCEKDGAGCEDRTRLPGLGSQKLGRFP